MAIIFKRQNSFTTLLPALACLLFCCVETYAQSGIVEAHVKSVSGNSQLLSSRRPGAFQIQPKLKLDLGDEIVTGSNGHVVISLSDRSQIHVFPNSRVKLNDFSSANSMPELLEIFFGRVRVKIHRIGGRPNLYRLNSPAASIAVRGTEFIVDVQANGETLVAVSEGSVEVSSRLNPDNKRLVTPGRSVLVRPGGEISLSVPGPGSELNGRARLTRDLETSYQRSIDSLVQNSIEPSPLLYAAFPDAHLDSLENPAYATEFSNAQGRLSLLPSVRKPDSLVVKGGSEFEYEFTNGPSPARFDYSVTPHLTFFTPIPNTRLILGGGVYAVRNNLHSLTTVQFDKVFVTRWGIESYTDFNTASVNAINTSLIAAYRFGGKESTSLGIEVEHLSGDGSYLNDRRTVTAGTSKNELIKSKTSLGRTRVTFGLAQDFSGGRKLGLYFRYGVSSSDQQNLNRPAEIGYPYSNSFESAAVSSESSEIGIRWRAPLTRRLFYGLEGSYLYERINTRYGFNGSYVKDPLVYERDRAHRARFGGGLGYALRSKTVLGLDVSGGFYRTTKPPEFSPFSIIQSESERGKFFSSHATVQTNLWRRSFASASFLLALRTTSVGYFGRVVPYERFTDKFSTAGIGWKFKPNLVAEYLISVDHSRRVPSHSLLLRYTFDLKISNEK